MKRSEIRPAFDPEIQRLTAGDVVVGGEYIYRPQWMYSRHRGVRIHVEVKNKHGHLTARFLGGPLQGQTRGAKPEDLAHQ